ncbi:MAG: hypothetical protein ACRECV_10290 [Xanthobacteraceae bacterium]
MRDAVSLDEMRERVGRAIFGNDWLGGRPDDEWALIRSHGPKKALVVRTDGSTVWLPHITPCPPTLVRKLDEALGRAERAQAQFVTVDTWIQEYVCVPHPAHGGDRKVFNATLRAYEAGKPDGRGARPRGPKPVTLERVVAEMRAHLDSGTLTAEGLHNAKEENLASGYGCSRDVVRKARLIALAPPPEK